MRVNRILSCNVLFVGFQKLDHHVTCHARLSPKMMKKIWTKQFGSRYSLRRICLNLDGCHDYQKSEL